MNTQLKNLLQAVVIGALLTISLYAQQAQPAPTWARGTWQWVQGSDRTMVISNNGTIALSTGGTTSYGVYNGGKIYLNGNASTITKVGNNIRTYNLTSGETSDYAKSTGVPAITDPAPAWSVGTWYWTGGPDRTMVIEASGRITLVTGGTTSQGGYKNGKIRLNGNASTLSQNGYDIRTYNETSHETSDYSRSPFVDGNANMEPPPNWAIGGWVGPIHSDRGINLESDGKVTLKVGMLTVHGRYYQGYLNFGSGQSLKLIKNGNKLRTRNESTNEIIDYTKLLIIHHI